MLDKINDSDVKRKSRADLMLERKFGDKTLPETQSKPKSIRPPQPSKAQENKDVTPTIPPKPKQRLSAGDISRLLEQSEQQEKIARRTRTGATQKIPTPPQDLGTNPATKTNEKVENTAVINDVKPSPKPDLAESAVAEKKTATKSNETVKTEEKTTAPSAPKAPKTKTQKQPAPSSENAQENKPKKGNAPAPAKASAPKPASAPAPKAPTKKPAAPAASPKPNAVTPEKADVKSATPAEDKAKPAPAKRKLPIPQPRVQGNSAQPSAPVAPDNKPSKDNTPTVASVLAPKPVSMPAAKPEQASEKKPAAPAASPKPNAVTPEKTDVKPATPAEDKSKPAPTKRKLPIPQPRVQGNSAQPSTPAAAAAPDNKPSKDNTPATGNAPSANSNPNNDKKGPANQAAPAVVEKVNKPTKPQILETEEPVPVQPKAKLQKIKILENEIPEEVKAQKPTVKPGQIKENPEPLSPDDTVQFTPDVKFIDPEEEKEVIKPGEIKIIENEPSPAPSAAPRPDSPNEYFDLFEPSTTPSSTPLDEYDLFEPDNTSVNQLNETNRPNPANDKDANLNVAPAQTTPAQEQEAPVAEDKKVEEPAQAPAPAPEKKGVATNIWKGGLKEATTFGITYIGGPVLMIAALALGMTGILGPVIAGILAILGVINFTCAKFMVDKIDQIVEQSKYFDKKKQSRKQRKEQQLDQERDNLKDLINNQNVRGGGEENFDLDNLTPEEIANRKVKILSDQEKFDTKVQANKILKDSTILMKENRKIQKEYEKLAKKEKDKTEKLRLENMAKVYKEAADNLQNISETTRANIDNLKGNSVEAWSDLAKGVESSLQHEDIIAYRAEKAASKEKNNTKTNFQDNAPNLRQTPIADKKAEGWEWNQDLSAEEAARQEEIIRKNIEAQIVTEKTNAIHQPINDIPSYAYDEKAEATEDIEIKPNESPVFGEEGNGKRKKKKITIYEHSR